MFVSRLTIYERSSGRNKKGGSGGEIGRLNFLSQELVWFAFEAEWGDKSRQAKKGVFRELYTGLPGVSLGCTNELHP